MTSLGRVFAWRGSRLSTLSRATQRSNLTEPPPHCVCGNFLRFLRRGAVYECMCCLPYREYACGNSRRFRYSIAAKFCSPSNQQRILATTVSPLFVCTGLFPRSRSKPPRWIRSERGTMTVSTNEKNVQPKTPGPGIWTPRGGGGKGGGRILIFIYMCALYLTRLPLLFRPIGFGKAGKKSIALGG